MDDRTNSAVIVDPGSEGDRLVEAIDKSGAKLEALLRDHIVIAGDLIAAAKAADDAQVCDCVGEEAMGRSYLSPSSRPTALRCRVASGAGLRCPLRGAPAA